MEVLLENIRKTHSFKFKRSECFKIYMALFDCSTAVRNTLMKLVDGSSYDFDNPDCLGRNELSSEDQAIYDNILRCAFATKALNRPDKEEFLLKFLYGRRLGAMDKLFVSIMEYVQNEMNITQCQKLEINSNLEVVGEKIQNILPLVSSEILKGENKEMLEHLVDVIRMFPELEPYFSFQSKIVEMPEEKEKVKCA